MSDFTIDDTMADIRYELDERKIYNDIRSEIGILISETVVDADPTYKWQVFYRYPTIPAGDTLRFIFSADHTTASNWEITGHRALHITNPYPNYASEPYYDYAINLEEITANVKYAVNVTNTGSLIARILFVVRYKYLATERIVHEEMVPRLLTVRATDDTSIAKYGRRVMNLTWSEGTEESEMQTIIEYYLTRHKDPYARLRTTIRGKTNALRTQFITREVSDLVTVVCTNLGINADYFINSISISDDATGVPVCVWELEAQRTHETLTLFVLDTSELDGTHVLGS